MYEEKEFTQDQVDTIVQLSKAWMSQLRSMNFKYASIDLKEKRIWVGDYQYLKSISKSEGAQSKLIPRPDQKDYPFTLEVELEGIFFYTLLNQLEIQDFGKDDN